MLKTNDSQVRLAQQQLAQVSGFLASDRQDLAGALHELATALGQVQAFIAGNRAPDQVEREQARRHHQDPRR